MDIKIARVRVKNSSISYCKFGNGCTPLIIIPGVSMQPVCLNAQAVATAYASFTDRFTVYLFDRRFDMPDGYSISDMADDVAQAMDCLEIGKACFFGASLGGMITLDLMMRYPHLIDKAVIASSCAHHSQNSKALFNRWLQFVDSGDLVGINRAFIHDVYSVDYVRQFADAFSAMEQAGTAEELRQFGIALRAIVEFSVSEETIDVAAPVLVLGSAMDKIFNREALEDLAVTVQGEFFLYQDFGHAVYDEAPDFKQRLLNFFAKN